MLRVALTIDCERFISFKQGNPRWSKTEKAKGRVNNLIKNFRYNKKGFEVVYNTIFRRKFPATFMLTGKLFSPLKSPDFIGWGYHSLNHLPLTLIPNDVLNREVYNIHNLKTFTAPMWMIEDTGWKDKEKIFKLLKQQNYTHAVYRGTNRGINHQHSNKIIPPFTKAGIKCIWVSGFFEGSWLKNKIDNIKREIINNLNSEGIYLLTTHDFSHKNNQNLLSMILFLKQLEEEGKIKIMKLEDIK